MIRSFFVYSKFIVLICGLLLTVSCSHKHFEKAPNGFRTINLGMSKSQVLECLNADSSYVLTPQSTNSNPLFASTTINHYDASLRFDFSPQNLLTNIRVSVGEVGRHYVDDHAVPYFYNCLATKYGEPVIGKDGVNGLDLFTWENKDVRRTLAAIHYQIPTGRFLLIFISDPKNISIEETDIRKWAEVKNRAVLPFEAERVISEDF